MELRQLRYFVTLAEMLSFSRAAESLYITQPTLSQQISALEKELDCTLFTREKRQVTLTEQGQLLLEEARFITSRASKLEARIRSSVGAAVKPPMELRIGVQPCCLNSPRVFRAIAVAQNRMVEEGLVSAFYFRSERLDDVDMEMYEAVICVHSRLLSSNLSDLDAHLLERDELVLAVRHREDGRGLEEFLSKSPLIAVKNDMYDIMSLVQTAEELGVALRVGFMKDTLTAVLSACAGIGGLIIPSQSAVNLFRGTAVDLYRLPPGVTSRESQIECRWALRCAPTMEIFCRYFDEAYQTDVMPEPPVLRTIPESGQLHAILDSDSD